MNSVVLTLLIGLVISQLIIFYLIILLFKKISKFNDLEVRQDQLMQEMDEAITVYLMEMREENDRLVAQLNALKKENTVYPQELEQAISHDRQQVNESSKMETYQQSIQLLQEQEQEQEQEQVRTKEMKLLVPKNIAASAYTRQKQQAHPQNEATLQTVDKDPQRLLSFEQQIIALYNEGNTIEDIAKKVGKGKTEIELLLKFHS